MKASSSAWLLVPLILSLCCGKAASHCVDDTIKLISDDGSVIVMASNIAYSIDVGDQPDTMVWLPGEDVSVCVLSNSEIKIINLDQNGASVSAEIK